MRELGLNVVLEIASHLRPDLRRRSLEANNQFLVISDILQDAELRAYVYERLIKLIDEKVKGQDEGAPQLLTTGTNNSQRIMNNGGIDLTRDKMELQVQSNGQEIRLNFDPAMIQQLQNASGLRPVIIDIQPMTTTVPIFLGIKNNGPPP